MNASGEVSTDVNYRKSFDLLKIAFPKYKSESVDLRKEKLIKLRSWIQANRSAIQEALYKDFRKPASEVDLTEILVVTAEIKHTLQSLNKWASTKSVKSPLFLLGTKSSIFYEPKGVCLIISPWNFPFNLTIGPLVSAISAGNSIILKPSEMTPNTSTLIRRLVTEVFSKDQVQIFEGDYKVSEELLKLPFDHIFFTGSPAVGKIVMKAAAENLTSVTLELGGKSPVIIDETANLEDSAHKIAWGKFINNGQTCIAPDYLLVQNKVSKEFSEILSKKIGELFDGDKTGIENSKDYARIINKRHTQRLGKMMNNALESGARLVHGGKIDEANNYIEPTILENPSKDSEILNDEIFGPLLPIVHYEKLDEALNFVNQKEKPLALYIFSKDQSNIDRILKQTSSGGVCINDTDLHFMNPDLPFGGVNNSGIGKGHGHAGFLSFSNEKAIMKQRIGFTGTKMIYPPYTNRVKKYIDLVLKYL